MSSRCLKCIGKGNINVPNLLESFIFLSHADVCVQLKQVMHMLDKNVYRPRAEHANISHIKKNCHIHWHDSFFSLTKLHESISNFLCIYQVHFLLSAL